MQTGIRHGAQWYPVRVNPGSHRVARKVETDDFPAYRIGETILERECRQQGIDVFSPSFWTARRHHRNNKLLEKRFALFPGYAFVLLHEYEFEKVRLGVPSILGFLGISQAGGPSGYRVPATFKEDEISKLMASDFFDRQACQFGVWRINLETAAREEVKLRQERRAISHRISSATRRQRSTISELARMQLAGMSKEDRARIEAIDRKLQALDNAFEALAS